MTAGGMKLSTKGDYGVRAMIALAKRWGEGPVQRHDIAQRRQIPESYLDHLLGQLRRFVNVYVNGEDVRFLDGLATQLAEGDEVSIVPAVAGG